MKRLVMLNVNGDLYEVAAPVHKTLLEVLREDIGLTGAKEGCGLGECGACTVIVDGRPILSCLSLAVEAEGKQVLTIEGLAPGGRLDPLQKAFLEHGAVQCGFCTPGIILRAKVLLEGNPAPTRDEVAFALAGNLCRCTGYQKIIKAIQGVGQTIAAR